MYSLIDFDTKLANEKKPRSPYDAKREKARAFKRGWKRCRKGPLGGVLLELCPQHLIHARLDPWRDSTAPAIIPDNGPWRQIEAARLQQFLTTTTALRSVREAMGIVPKRSRHTTSEKLKDLPPISDAIEAKAVSYDKIRYEFQAFKGRGPLPRGARGGREFAADAEMISAAHEALVRAKKAFKPERGFKLSTYTAKSVKNAVRGAAKPRVNDWMGDRGREVSFNTPIGFDDDEGGSLADLVTDDAHDEREDIGDEARKDLEKILRPTEFQVWQARHGGESRREIGKRLNLSTERIRQIEEVAVERAAGQLPRAKLLSNQVKQEFYEQKQMGRRHRAPPQSWQAHDDARFIAEWTARRSNPAKWPCSMHRRPTKAPWFKIIEPTDADTTPDVAEFKILADTPATSSEEGAAKSRAIRLRKILADDYHADGDKPFAEAAAKNNLTVVADGIAMRTPGPHRRDNPPLDRATGAKQIAAFKKLQAIATRHRDTLAEIGVSAVPAIYREKAAAALQVIPMGPRATIERIVVLRTALWAIIHTEAGAYCKQRAIADLMLPAKKLKLEEALLLATAQAATELGVPFAFEAAA